MKQRLFATLSLAGFAMATFGATKPKTAINSSNGIQKFLLRHPMMLVDDFA